MVEFKIDVSGAEEVAKRLGDMFTPTMMKFINKEVAYNAQEQTADHIAKASVSRHKTAQRLGAKPTGHFELAPGRVRAIPPAWDETGATITIAGTPGILRAFAPVKVTAKKANNLTIPIHRIAYGKRVADMQAEGYKIFRPKGKKVLLGTKDGETYPFYALKKSVTLPQDEGLLPTSEAYADKAIDVINAVVDSFGKK